MTQSTKKVLNYETWQTLPITIPTNKAEKQMEDEENKQANEKKLNRSKRIGTNTQSLCIELSEKMEKLCEMDSE